MTGIEPSRRDDRQPLVISADMLDPAGAATRVEFERGMRYAAPATLGLIAACCAVFCWQVGSGALETEESLVQGGALITAGVLRGEWWRFVSSMFLHGGLDHLLGNMAALFILGIACEHAFGSPTMIGLYGAAGLAGGVATAAVNPLPTVGASGAVFGLMGCLVAVLLRLRRTVQVRDGRIGAVVGLWAMWQLVLGFTDPLIANFAHLGGFVAGFLLGLVVPPRPFLRASAAAGLPAHRRL